MSEAKARVRKPRASGGRRADTRPAADPSGTESTSGPQGVPLDMLLIEAARGPLRRAVPGRAVAELLLRMLQHPGRPAGEAQAYAVALARILAGRSPITPDPRDRRFS